MGVGAHLHRAGNVDQQQHGGWRGRRAARSFIISPSWRVARAACGAARSEPRRAASAGGAPALRQSAGASREPAEEHVRAPAGAAPGARTSLAVPPRRPVRSSRPRATPVLFVADASSSPSSPARPARRPSGLRRNGAEQRVESAMRSGGGASVARGATDVVDRARPSSVGPGHEGGVCSGAIREAVGAQQRREGDERPAGAADGCHAALSCR